MIKKLLQTYNDFYKNKGIAVKIFSSIFAIFSISTAHYLGYVSVLPMQIVILGGVDLLIAVTKTFILYVTASAIITKIMANLLATYFTVINIYIIDKSYQIAKRINIKTIPEKIKKIFRSIKTEAVLETKPKNKPNALREKILKIKQHEKNLIDDADYYKISQVVFFSLLMLFGYLKPSYILKNIDVAGFVVSFLFVLSLLLFALAFRTNFIFLGASIFKSRLKRKKLFFINFATESLHFLIILTIVISLIGGAFRIIYIKSLPSVLVKNQLHTVNAKIILSNNKTSIFLEDNGKDSRYIFFSPAGEVIFVKNEPSNAWLNNLLKPN